MVDTCQAATIANAIQAPRIITIGSSRKGENSYSYESDRRLGVAVIDRFSYSLNLFFRSRVGVIAGNHVDHVDDVGSALPSSTSISSSTSSSSSSQHVLDKLHELTLQDLLDGLDPHFMYSRVGVHLSPHARQPRDIPLIDFFGNGGLSRDGHSDDRSNDRGNVDEGQRARGSGSTMEVMKEDRTHQDVNTSGASVSRVLSFRDPPVSKVVQPAQHLEHGHHHQHQHHHRHGDHRPQQSYLVDHTFRKRVQAQYDPYSYATLHELFTHPYHLFLILTLLFGCLCVRRGRYCI